MTKQQIKVFEHQSLRLGQNGFCAKTLKALQRHYGEGKLYYSLIHNGVRFNQFVGVIQVGNTTIEVLPKIDKAANSDQEFWQKRLIEMLLAVNSLEANITGSANLNLKANSILEVYFALFINEVEGLLHKGLIKQYRKDQANLPVLKGRMNFNQHIRQNIVHKECFFVEYTVYDQYNLYNQILYKTIKLIGQLNTNQQLASQINLLLLNFPEMVDVDSKTFERIVYNRKNQHYQVALNIAKLFLLNYHPDITHGQESVLSLMFDMNRLWEKFVLISLQRVNKNLLIQIKEQQSKSFWKSDNHTTTMKPDIVISNKEIDKNFVLDTKWKCPDYQKPSTDDLRQLYVYHHYYDAEKVALVYPSQNSEVKTVSGKYIKIIENEQNKKCSLLFLHTLADNRHIKEWQIDIAEQVFAWCHYN